MARGHARAGLPDADANHERPESAVETLEWGLLRADGALVQVLTFREKSCPKPCIVDGGCCRVFETMRLGVNDE